MAQETTKKCPQCGNTHLALLRTIIHKGAIGKKVCTDCNLSIPWKLDEGQEALK